MQPGNDGWGDQRDKKLPMEPTRAPWALGGPNYLDVQPSRPSADSQLDSGAAPQGDSALPPPFLSNCPSHHHLHEGPCHMPDFSYQAQGLEPTLNRLTITCTADSLCSFCSCARASSPGQGVHDWAASGLSGQCGIQLPSSCCSRSGRDPSLRGSREAHSQPSRA